VTIFLNARSKSSGELLVPISRANSRSRFARSSSVMCCFLAGILELYHKFVSACTAAKEIVLGIAGNRRQVRSRFVFDPATGALIVSPELDFKIRKSLRRAARRIARRARLRQLRFEIKYSALKVRLSALYRLRNLRRVLLKLSFGRHNRVS